MPAACGERMARPRMSTSSSWTPVALPSIVSFRRCSYWPGFFGSNDTMNFVGTFGSSWAMVVSARNGPSIKSDPLGNIDLADLRAKAAQHKDTLACLMVTYPSTHGSSSQAFVRSVRSCIRMAGRSTWMAPT